ncbi:MAG: hypothetical protein R2861_02180 [Desulfobacterales bacterium]
MSPTKPRTSRPLISGIHGDQPARPLVVTHDRRFLDKIANRIIEN